MAIKKLTSLNFPFIPITLIVRQRELKLEALLDTGFDGFVVVPTEMLSNGHPPDGYLPWTLADGSKTLAPAYIGVVKLKGIGSFSVIVTALGDEVMVGRRLSDKFKLILDHGKKLIVEL